MSDSLKQFQHSTVRIETRSSDDSYCEGTAFIYEHAAQDKTYPFLVTAKHLIHNAAEGRITLRQSQNGGPTDDGYTLDVESFSKLWSTHPNKSLNIAVTPLVPFIKHIEASGVALYYKPLSKANLFKNDSTFEAEAEANVGIGSELIYLGYPEHCWDKKNLLPVFRKAMIASPFDEMYQGLMQTLVDTNVMHGSSGSPVFYGNNNQLIGMLTNFPQIVSSKTNNQENLFFDPALETPMGIVIRITDVIQVIESYLKEKGLN